MRISCMACSFNRRLERLNESVHIVDALEHYLDTRHEIVVGSGVGPYIHLCAPDSFRTCADCGIRFAVDQIRAVEECLCSIRQKGEQK